MTKTDALFALYELGGLARRVDGLVSSEAMGCFDKIKDELRQIASAFPSSKYTISEYMGDLYLCVSSSDEDEEYLISDEAMECFRDATEFTVSYVSELVEEDLPLLLAEAKRSNSPSYGLIAADLDKLEELSLIGVELVFSSLSSNEYVCHESSPKEWDRLCAALFDIITKEGKSDD